MILEYMFGPQRRRNLQKMITIYYLWYGMKLYATLPSNLTTMLNKTTNMLRTIGLELGQEKCAIQHFKRGKQVEESEHVLLGARVIMSILELVQNIHFGDLYKKLVSNTTKLS